MTWGWGGGRKYCVEGETREKEMLHCATGLACWLAPKSYASFPNNTLPVGRKERKLKIGGGGAGQMEVGKGEKPWGFQGRKWGDGGRENEIPSPLYLTWGRPMVIERNLDYWPPWPGYSSPALCSLRFQEAPLPSCTCPRRPQLLFPCVACCLSLIYLRPVLDPPGSLAAAAALQGYQVGGMWDALTGSREGRDQINVNVAMTPRRDAGMLRTGMLQTLGATL